MQFLLTEGKQIKFSSRRRLEFHSRYACEILSLKVTKRVLSPSDANRQAPFHWRNQNSTFAWLHRACTCSRILFSHRSLPPNIGWSEDEWRAFEPCRISTVDFLASRDIQRAILERFQLQKHPNTTHHTWFWCRAANSKRKIESTEVWLCRLHNNTIRLSLSRCDPTCQHRMKDWTATESHQMQNLKRRKI